METKATTQETISHASHQSRAAARPEPPQTHQSHNSSTSDLLITDTLCSEMNFKFVGVWEKKRINKNKIPAVLFRMFKQNNILQNVNRAKKLEKEFYPFPKSFIFFKWYDCNRKSNLKLVSTCEISFQFQVSEFQV